MSAYETKVYFLIYYFHPGILFYLLQFTYFTLFSVSTHISNSSAIAKQALSEMSDLPIKVIAEAQNLYLAEFPTLLALQEYAKQAHPDTLLLYLHTKGEF